MKVAAAASPVLHRCSAGPRVGFGGTLAGASFSWLAVPCWGMHMFLRRRTPSSSLVDSLSKASYLARPYVLGHGESGMWKEHRVILGLQTPAGAIQSKFGLQGEPGALELCSTGHP